MSTDLAWSTLPCLIILRRKRLLNLNFVFQYNKVICMINSHTHGVGIHLHLHYKAFLIIKVSWAKI